MKKLNTLKLYIFPFVLPLEHCRKVHFNIKKIRRIYFYIIHSKKNLFVLRRFSAAMIFTFLALWFLYVTIFQYLDHGPKATVKKHSEGTKDRKINQLNFNIVCFRARNVHQSHQKATRTNFLLRANNTEYFGLNFGRIISC